MRTKWINHCNHDSQFCIGSVQGEERIYDVYVYPAHGTHEVCARYGNNPKDCLSTGLIGDLFRLSTLSDDYMTICNFLLQHGSLQYCRI
jgi:hypothetical protein